MTKTETLPNLASIVHESEQAALEAAAALAKAQAAQARAQEAQAKADAARASASERYARKVRADNLSERPRVLQAVADAKSGFAAAVLAGEPFGVAFLEVAKAEAALYAHELQYADALGMLGQSTRTWPEPRPINLAAALDEALAPEATRLAEEAAEDMTARKHAWIAEQVAEEEKQS